MQNENISNLSGKSDDTLEAMIEYAMLFDFYGALLKDKNNEIFEDYMFNDMSLSEIAKEHDMSRQGVRDIVLRSREKLVSYEEKLGLVERFNAVKQQINYILEKTGEIKNSIDNDGEVSVIPSRKLDEYFDMLQKTAGIILEDL